MNKERKLFWTVLVMAVGGLAFVAWRHTAGSPPAWPSSHLIAPVTAVSPVEMDPFSRRPVERPVAGGIPASIMVATPSVYVVPVEDADLQRFDPGLMENADFEEIVRIRLWLAEDELNNPLIRKLGLTADELQRLKDLIVDGTVAVSVQAGRAMAQGRPAMEKAWDEAAAAFRPRLDAQWRQVLGESRFAQYEAGREDYAHFNAIKFLDGQQVPLADQRADQVIAVMQDERHVVNAAAAQIQADEARPLSTTELSQMQELIAGRAFGRLQNILDRGQLEALGWLLAPPAERSTGGTVPEMPNPGQ